MQQRRCKSLPEPSPTARPLSSSSTAVQILSLLSEEGDTRTAPDPRSQLGWLLLRTPPLFSAGTPSPRTGQRPPAGPRLPPVKCPSFGAREPHALPYPGGMRAQAMVQPSSFHREPLPRLPASPRVGCEKEAKPAAQRERLHSRETFLAPPNRTPIESSARPPPRKGRRWQLPPHARERAPPPSLQGIPTRRPGHHLLL